MSPKVGNHYVSLIFYLAFYSAIITKFHRLLLQPVIGIIYCAQPNKSQDGLNKLL